MATLTFLAIYNIQVVHSLLARREYETLEQMRQASYCRVCAIYGKIIDKRKRVNYRTNRRTLTI